MINAVLTWFPVGRKEVNLKTTLPALPSVGDSFSTGNDDVPTMWVRHLGWEPDGDGGWLVEVVLGEPAR
jgi:hypothetical protein